MPTTEAAAVCAPPLPEAIAWVGRSERAAVLLERARTEFGGTLHLPRELAALHGQAEPFDAVVPLLQSLFRERRPIAAVLASGIAVRALAPLLRDKYEESAVVVLDEAARFAVPVLGGHRGANALAHALEARFGCAAAITTASEAVLGTALDSPPHGWTLRNPRDLAPFLARLLRGEGIAASGLASDAPWLRALPRTDASDGLRIHAAPWGEETPAPGTETLLFGVGAVALGVGASRGCPTAELEALVGECLETHNVPREALVCVASWEGKRDEVAIVEVCKQLGHGLYGASSARLAAEEARLSETSEAVRAAVGAPGVCEAAALAALGPASRLLAPKVKSRHATCALACAPPPQAKQSPHAKRGARSPNDGGALAVIGLGAGDDLWLTAEAQAQLRAADAWVGYSGYLERLLPQAGARALHAFALGEEEARARHALELAASGVRTALVSSGDPGVYAMAAPLMEIYESLPEPRPELIVVPGISAFQAVAARAGAPVGHDFCCISLSDLLTPAERILQRVRAAASGDFVVAFYNPASKTRRALLPQALEALRAERGETTPVILAHAVGHDDEAILHTTLGALLGSVDKVQMRDLVMVGSTATRSFPNGAGETKTYTPRGYQTKLQ